MNVSRLALCACFLLVLGSAIFGQQQYYAVTGGSSTEGIFLSVIDVNAQVLVGRLSVPQPIGGVALTSDGLIAYGTLYGTPTVVANGLVIADITDPTAPVQIAIIQDICGQEGPGSNGPAAVALTKDDAFAYIACLGSPLGTPGKWVVKFDTATQQATRIDMSAPTGMANPGPFGVFAHPNEAEMWITIYGHGVNPQGTKIVRINIADDTILGTIDVGASPTGGAFCSDQTYGYFSVNNRNPIGTNRILKIGADGVVQGGGIQVPVGTVGIAFNSDCSLAYAGGFGNLTFQKDRVITIDTATGAVSSFTIPPATSGPFNVLVTSDDFYLIVGMFGSLTRPGTDVRIYQRDTLELLGIVEVGQAPSGIAVTP
ncbi:MAG: hypothetical protein HYR55_08720 [Acidobacteria bacterium]|nr:hypothetical protein [Acidobacteriota bacterium]MBI3655576.1 hypothetical protein [Acidobacteriota bacterium]